MIENKEENLIIPSQNENQIKTENHQEKKQIIPKSKKAMLFYGFLLASSGTIFGYKVAFYNSFFEPFIEQIYEITNEDKKTEIYSNLAFLFPVGCLIASFSAFRIYEKIGRFDSFKLLCFLSVFNFLVNNFVNVFALYFGRVLDGFISCFLLFVSHLMIKEVVWEGVRGMVANSFIVFVMFGANLGFIFANRNTVVAWRWLMFFPVLIDLSKNIIFHYYFPIRSPNYLYKKTSAETLPEKLTKNYQIFYSKKNSIKLTKNFLKQKSLSKTSKKITIRSLLQKDYKKHMYFALFINLSQQITGITTLINFSTPIFKTQNIKHPHIYTIVMGLSSLIAVIIITLLGNKITKKKPLFISLLFQLISWFFLILAIFYQNHFFLIFGACFFTSFNAVYKSVHLSYVVDLIPSQGLGVASVFKWAVNMLFAKCFLYWVELVGIFFVFLGFFVMTAVCFVVFVGFAVCTEGKSEMEIFEEFKNKRFMR